ARDFCLLEAGYMSQLLMSGAPAGLGLCPVGWLDFDRIQSLFALEPSHCFLHALLGGRVDGVARATAPPGAAARSAPPAPRAATLEQELRAFLHAKLPEHMVPAAFLLLDTLPLTPNGKVDRGALPVPAPPSATRETGYVAPRTTLERTLTTIVQDVLHLEHVGIADNLFD